MLTTDGSLEADDLDADHEHAPGEPCECSVSQAQEFHALADALAAHLAARLGLESLDLCRDEGDTLGGPEGEDLQLFHDLAVAHGATCEADDEGDGPGDEGDSSAEIPAYRPAAG